MNVERRLTEDLLFRNNDRHKLGIIYTDVQSSPPYHGLTAEEVGVVLIDELLHTNLPHPEHLGAFVLQKG